ncbi:MAG: HDOD domain-containing protein [Actinobacteria bacterium]|nr:HDOD domain-containing protein [Actinomycetota bacterium]MCG2803605.1 HDOD domain-containing protein [Cellulomonas sp.]
MTEQSAAPWSGAALVNQPVADPSGRVTAYAVRAMVPTQHGDPEDAAEVSLDAAYDATDLSSLSAGQPLLIDATRRVLGSANPDVVARVSPALAREPGIERLVAWRHARGLQTALDDFTAQDAQLALLPMSRYVTVDVARQAGRLVELAGLAHDLGAAVIADGATTWSSVERSFAAGADLVQGRVVDDREVERGGLSANELHCLELLSLLDEDPVDQNAVIGLVAADPNLAVGVLHLVNSAVFALPRAIDSVRQAVVMVGPRLLRALASSALTQAGRSTVDDLWRVLSRALACWQLSDDDAGYTVGLLSAVAEQRGTDLRWLAQMAGLSQTTTAALVDHAGPLGEALACIRAHEAGNPDVALRLGVDPHVVSRAWLEGLPEALAIASALARPDAAG